MSILTATKWTHFSILSVNLANICNTLAQDIYRDLIAILVFPVGSLIPGTLHLRTGIS